MTETELWIEQAREYLKKAAHRGGSSALAESLQDHVKHIDLVRIQADLGCGDDCTECSWGSLGGHPLGSETCRLLVLQQAIEDLRTRVSQGKSARDEAAKLLQLLDSLPSPRR